MRRCLKEPIPEIFSVWEVLSAAVDAHLEGNYSQADDLFRQADSPEVWNWLNPAWTKVHDNVVWRKPAGDTQIVPKEIRDPDRKIAPSIRSAVLRRDGYRCRYCGIPVVHADIRKIAAKLYPDSVPWDARDPAKQHSGFQCLWLQFEHVEPHSHGGRSTEDNVVISCALCNFGKDKFTLRQLDLLDPRLRPPEPLHYDGLERLKGGVSIGLVKSLSPPQSRSAYGRSPPVKPEEASREGARSQYFIAGAWISSGYLHTPPIDGKTRWFLLSDDVIAEPAEIGGIEGCLLTCSPERLAKRGIDGDRLLVSSSA